MYKNKKHPPPDTCGTQLFKVCCCIPTLTHCLKQSLHRSKEERRNYSKLFLKGYNK